MGNALTRLFLSAGLLLGPKPTKSLEPPKFSGQHTNPKRNAERRLCRQMGHRQHRMLVKRLRRAEKEARWDEEATREFDRPV